MAVDPAELVQQAKLGRGRLRVCVAGLEAVDCGLDLGPQAPDHALPLGRVLAGIIKGRERAAFEARPGGSHVRGGLPVDFVVERRVKVLQGVAEQQAQRLGWSLEDPKTDLSLFRIGDRGTVQVRADLAVELVD
jgi:hypothetical protein